MQCEGTISVIVKKVVIRSNGGCKLRAIFMGKVFRDWSVINILDVRIKQTENFEKKAHCFCSFSLQVRPCILI